MQVIQWDKNAQKKINSICKTDFDSALFKKVSKIIQEVSKKGDAAVRRFTKEFDGIDIPAKKVKVSQSDVNHAYEMIDVKLVSVLNHIVDNIKRYYKKELIKPYRIKTKEGAVLGKKYMPIERVGLYIPGGQAPLVSTICMTAVPAQVAGVKDFVMVTPPNKETGHIDPHLLVVADLLGIKEIYKMGGAQAIAALAFGTKTVNKVDKIVGPGNQFVTEAKRQVYGFVDIDMTAGPSEVAIIADGVSFLITHSKKIIDAVKRRVENGYIVVTKSLQESIQVSNYIAPEHLEVFIKKPKSVLNKITNAGAIFLGPYSPAVIGDYAAGPSHVLPTGRTARFFSPLSANDFIKGSQYVEYTKEALLKERLYVRRLTEIEGLVLHRLSMEARFSDYEQVVSSDETKG